MNAPQMPIVYERQNL